MRVTTTVAAILGVVAAVSPQRVNAAACPIETGDVACPAAFLRGDANLDGVLNGSDAVALSDWVNFFPGNPMCQEVADVDGNGVVEQDDVDQLIGFLYFGTAPAPGDYPAQDQTCRKRQTTCEAIVGHACDAMYVAGWGDSDADGHTDYFGTAHVGDERIGFVLDGATLSPRCTTPPRVASRRYWTLRNPVAGDWDGDGVDDYARWWRDEDGPVGALEVLSGATCEIVGEAVDAGWLHFVRNSSRLLGDIDGDGVNEVRIFERSGPLPKDGTYTIRSGADYRDGVPSTMFFGAGALLGDIDCDGQPDHLLESQFGNFILFGDGNIAQSPGGERLGWLGDMDGDGCDDVSYGTSTDFYSWVAQGVVGELLFPEVGSPHNIGNWQRGSRIVDLDGDGRRELLFERRSGGHASGVVAGSPEGQLIWQAANVDAQGNDRVILDGGPNELLVSINAPDAVSLQRIDTRALSCQDLGLGHCE